MPRAGLAAIVRKSAGDSVCVVLTQRPSTLVEVGSGRCPTPPA
jgi:hypothetical protein